MEYKTSLLSLSFLAVLAAGAGCVDEGDDASLDPDQDPVESEVVSNLGAACGGPNVTLCQTPGTYCKVSSAAPDASGTCVATTPRLTAGSFHACALIHGRVQCWGENQMGQLGNNQWGPTHLPTRVVGLPAGVTSITAGTFHTCAVTSGKKVMCWGDNTHGQLGNNSTVTARMPVNVQNLSSVVALAGHVGLTPKSHMCALLNNGTVKCWGANESGQLGNNSTTDAKLPVTVTGLTGVKAIAVGETSSCAITNAGALKCWGQPDHVNFPTRIPVPTTVPGFASGVAAVTIGELFTCALMTSGAVKCWGYNISGSLGNNGPTTGNGMISRTPVNVIGLGAGSGTKAISAGLGYACAQSHAGGLKCWGDNVYGVCANPALPNTVTAPVTIGSLAPVANFATGRDFACATDTAGVVKCWGANLNRQVGRNTNQLYDLPVGPVEKLF